MESYKKIAVRTWYLQYQGNVPKVAPGGKCVRWQNPKTSEYLSLYKMIGEPWGWTGRMLLSEEELSQKLISPFIEIYKFYVDDVLRGYFEIDRLMEGKAEIVYLGLLPSEIGKGFGGELLRSAIHLALSESNSEVWLHTCEYDHHNALTFYQNQGFTVVEESIEHEYYPVSFLELWDKKNPGSNSVPG